MRLENKLKKSAMSQFEWCDRGEHDDFNGLNQMEQQTVVNYAFP